MRRIQVSLLLVLLALFAPAAADAQQQESLHAAAKLTGLTSGMAMACGLDSKPVLYAYRDLLDRKRVRGGERDRLVQTVSTASDRGFATQRQPGAMACSEVRTQMQRTIRRLAKAR
ncbi:MAG TPA: hypothetical protein VFU46_02355 [Gemmatimonadales bacterium]|nr:hypothetical protein [Gemmatimonadales bacterium]